MHGIYHASSMDSLFAGCLFPTGIALLSFALQHTHYHHHPYIDSTIVLLTNIKNKFWEYFSRLEPFHKENLQDSKSAIVMYLQQFLKSVELLLKMT